MSDTIKPDNRIKLSGYHFGKDFKWGTSVSAYQIEGAHLSDGKGLSIWDVFSGKKGNTADNHNGNRSGNFYHHYRNDIELLSALQIPNFRFSLSWSRILPKGIHHVNPKGLDFYDRLIDALLEKEIDPWVTLYHWDLPQELEKKGGWTNRDILKWFTEYIAICADRFGDRVKRWMVLNEPMVFTGAGYFLGIHAPGRKGMQNFLPAAHHATLAQAEGGRVLRSINSTFEIGTTFSCAHIEPASSDEKDKGAALRMDALLNRMFIEPAQGMGYPVRELTALKPIEKYFKAGDEANLEFDFDFIGIQNYTREIVAYSFFTPYLRATIIDAWKRNVPTTAMNWEIYPAGIYHLLKKFNSYPHVKKIIVTENGAAVRDIPTADNKIMDIERINFLNDYLYYVYKAKKEGVKVDGYFVWSFMDNFEWAEGFHPRFGLVYVDYETEQRIVKASGHWYKGFIHNETRVLSSNKLASS